MLYPLSKSPWWLLQWQSQMFQNVEQYDETLAEFVLLQEPRVEDNTFLEKYASLFYWNCWGSSYWIGAENRAFQIGAHVQEDKHSRFSEIHTSSERFKLFFFCLITKLSEISVNALIWNANFSHFLNNRKRGPVIPVIYGMLLESKWLMSFHEVPSIWKRVVKFTPFRTERAHLKPTKPSGADLLLAH